MALDSAAQKLWEDGFAVIENFIDAEDMKAMRNRMHEIVDSLDPKEHQTIFSSKTIKPCDDYFMNSGDSIRFFFEEEALDNEGNLLVEKHLSINKIGHALHCLEPAFMKVAQSKAIKDLAKAFGFIDPVICQSMYIFKQPRIGGVVLPHQDSTFTNTNPKRLVGIWIPLEDATKENGCLWFIPGSHKNGVHNDRYLVRTQGQGSEVTTTFTNPLLKYDESLFVPVEVKAGSLVLIHGEVVHKSEANKSEKSRHAFAFHIFDNHDVEYSNLNWLQPTDKGTFVHLLEQAVS